MKFVISFLFLNICLFQVAQATSDIASFPSNISYQKNLKAHYAEYPAEIDKVIEHISFNTLVGSGRTIAINAIDQVNRIYIPKNLSKKELGQRLILARSGFEVSAPVQYGKVYAAGKGFLVHFKSKNSGDVALFFKGFAVDRVEEVARQVTSTLNSSGQSASSFGERLGNLLIPSALADDTKGGFCDNAFVDHSSPESDSSALQKLWACTKGAAGGAWDSTGGSVEVVGKIVWQAVRHPVDTFGPVVEVVKHPVENFNKASEEFGQMSDLFSNISSAFGDMKAGFEALPSDVKIKIGCEIVSSIGVTGLIAYFSGGMGSPLLFKSIASAALKIADSLPEGMAVTSKVLALAKGMQAKASAAEQSIANIKDEAAFLKETKAETALLEKKVAPKTDDVAWARIDTTEYLADADFVAKLKREDPEMYAELVNANMEERKLAVLKAMRKDAQKVLDDNKMSLVDKAKMRAYFAASTCATSLSVESPAGASGTSNVQPSKKSDGVQ